MGKKLQFVWPKDGHKGRNDRGFCGGLGDIIQGKGPDIFLQRKGSRAAIRPDHWGNWQVTFEIWDSYHDPAAHHDELSRSYQNGLFSASRGNRRYDPATRRYTTWSVPHDWYGQRIDEENRAYYPRFTEAETRKMLRRFSQHKRVNPRAMGPGWTIDGPKRFQQEYDGFWQEAHRIGENYRERIHPLSDGINPNLRMQQQWPHDLQEWLVNDPWHPQNPFGFY